MDNIKRLRQLVKFLSISVLLVGTVRVWKFLKELARKHSLVKKLPTIRGNCDSYVLGWASSSAFIGDKPRNFETVRNSFIGGLLRSLRKDESLRREGILNMWYLNPKFSTAFPYHNLNVVIVYGMSKMRFILASRNQHLFSKGNSYQVSHPLIGRSVLATSGQEWRPQREILDHGFKDDLMAQNYPSILENVDNFVQRWQKVVARNESVNALEETLKLTMDVLGSYAFSYSFNSVTAPTTKDAPLYDAFNTILQILNLRCILPPLAYAQDVPFLQINREFNQAMAKLDEKVYDIVTTRKREMEQRRRTPTHKEEKPRDLLDVLLSDKYTDGKQLTEQQMVDNMKTMLFAGHDTTGALLCWLIHLLATHQNILKQVRDEFENRIGTDREANPTLEDLEALPYLNACIIEALRMYPSAGFTRNALEDVDIEGYVVPKGTEILMLPYLTHRDPDVYPNPDQYKPERWVERCEEDDVSLQAQFAKITHSMPFLPFSAGIRNCVGRKLALTETRVALIKILQNFDLQPVHTEDFQTDPSLWLTLVPVGVHVKPIARQ